MRFLLVLSIAATLAAQDRWIAFHSGPFQVLTNAGERQGRETLVELEQFRHALGRVLGKDELHAAWPIRVLVFKSGKPAPSLSFGRDAFTGALAAKDPLSPPFLEECARILIEGSTHRLSRDLENGLARLFSTAAVTRARVTLGQPPPEPQRDRNWAKAHMFTIPPDYYGKLRVLVHNLEQGVAPGPAYRNAFTKDPADVEKEVDAYLRAGQFSTVPISGRPINPDRDFNPKPVERDFAEAALADLLLADPARTAEARAAYQALLKSSPQSPEAHEGLGLVALRESKTEEARKEFAAAVEVGSASARAHFEYARLEADQDKARAALEKAAGLNPRWAEPHWELAKLEADGARKRERLKTAAALAKRNPEYWMALARAALEQNEFAESSHAWLAAEHAAPNEQERERIRQLRAQAERDRQEREEAERQRIADEKRREIEELKAKAMASIQAALDKANRENPPTDTGEVVPWWDDPRPKEKVNGTLQQVDCLGKQFRLVIQTEDGKRMRLLIRDPGHVVILGGERTLGCGPQRPPRRIAVEYFTGADARLGTAGEAAVIQFP